MESLDRQRLGKNRVESMQILHNLLGKKVEKSVEHGPRVVPVESGRGWTNHPIVLMWQNNIEALAVYCCINCDVWMHRGYVDTVKRQVQILLPGVRSDLKVRIPKWFGDPDFHRSHQSNLLRKDPVWYRPIFGNDVPDNLPYIWPRG